MRMDEEALGFLEKLGMSKYISGFESLGFDTLETLAEANDDILKQVGVPIGFRIKFNKAKSDLRFKQVAGASSSNFLATQKAESFNLIINDEWSASRQARRSLPENPARPLSQQSASKEPSGSAKTQPLVDTGIEACDFESAPQINTNKFCYRCFKRISEVFASTYAPNKSFCSSVCLKFFFLEQSTLCSNPDCGAVSVKSSSILAGGAWFCSESCSQTRPKLLEPVEVVGEENSSRETSQARAHRPDSSPEDRQEKDLPAKPASHKQEEIDLSFDF